MSALGIGTAVLPPTGSGVFDTRAAADIIEAAIAAGCRHVDTADGYYLGHSERLVGSVLRGHHDVVVTTKIGWNFYNRDVDAVTKVDARRRLGMDLDALAWGSVLPFDHGQNFTTEYVQFAVERSLERLGRDCVDILLLHVPPHHVLQRDGWMEPLAALKAAGRCRAHGVSVRHPFEVLAAIGHGEPDVVQVPILPALSGPMELALRVARSKGVAVIGREIFGGGRILRALQHARLDVPSARVCGVVIDAVIANELVDAVVVGCSSVAQVQEDFGTPGVTAGERAEVLAAVRALTATRAAQPYGRRGRPDIERLDSGS